MMKIFLFRHHDKSKSKVECDRIAKEQLASCSSQLIIGKLKKELLTDKPRREPDYDTSNVRE
jgi:hypothetical protein